MSEYTANAVKSRKNLPTAASTVSVLRFLDKESSQVRERVWNSEAVAASGPGLDADRERLSELEAERSAWREYLRWLSGTLPGQEARL